MPSMPHFRRYFRHFRHVFSPSAEKSRAGEGKNWRRQKPFSSWHLRYLFAFSVDHLIRRIISGENTPLLVTGGQLHHRL